MSRFFMVHCVYMGCSFAPHGKYDWTVRVRQRYGISFPT